MTKQNDKIPSSYEKDAIKSSSGTRRFWRSMKTRIILDMISKYARPGMKILDAGCGPGVVLEEIRRESGKSQYGLFGTDVRPDMLKIAGKQVPKARFFASDLEVSIGAKNDFFDVVYSAHVIEHLTRPEKAFKEFYRVLRPGGTLIITTPNYRSLWPVLEWVWDRFYVPASGGGNGGGSGESRAIWGEQHVTKFNQSLLSSLMRTCGFEVAEIGTSLQASIFASMLSDDVAKRMREFERRRIKPLGIELYAVGVKPRLYKKR